MRPACSTVVAALLVLAASPSAAQGRDLARAWSRACEEITEPVPATDGASVFACQARFDARLGRYGGRVPIGLVAAVDGERGIAESYGQAGGLALVRLVGGRPDARPVARARGGTVEAVAVSPDRRRVASLESLGAGRVAIFVRALPRLQTVSRTELADVPPPVLDRAATAFSPEGGVLVALPCAGARCPTAGVVRLDGDRLVPAVGLDGPFEAVGFAPGGARVAIVRARGKLEVRATATGALVAAFELGDVPARVALSPDAAMVAAGGAAELRVFRLGGAAPQLVAHERPGAHELAFAPVGERLFVSGTVVAALAPGGTAVQPPSAGSLGLAPPTGWIAGVVRDGVLTFPNQRGAEYAAESGLVAAYANREGRGQARIVVTDADEFATFTDPQRWGIAVAERYEPYSPLVSAVDRRSHHFQVRRDAEGRRSMEMYFRGDGCDPSDRWVRIEERGEALVRTTLEVPSFVVEPARITGWLQDLRFDSSSGLPVPRANAD